jgi:hypothetical protein
MSEQCRELSAQPDGHEQRLLRAEFDVGGRCLYVPMTVVATNRRAATGRLLSVSGRDAGLA